MCGDVITLVSMMYIIMYIDSIVGIHSFIPATQEPIQNWRYLNYQNVCKTLFLWASAPLAPFCRLWCIHMVNMLHVHSHVVTIIIHVHSNKVTISHVHSNRVAIIHVHSNGHKIYVHSNGHNNTCAGSQIHVHSNGHVRNSTCA